MKSLLILAAVAAAASAMEGLPGSAKKLIKSILENGLIPGIPSELVYYPSIGQEDFCSDGTLEDAMPLTKDVLSCEDSFVGEEFCVCLSFDPMMQGKFVNICGQCQMGLAAADDARLRMNMQLFRFANAIDTRIKKMNDLPLPDPSEWRFMVVPETPAQMFEVAKLAMALLTNADDSDEYSDEDGDDDDSFEEGPFGGKGPRRRPAPPPALKKILEKLSDKPPRGLLEKIAEESLGDDGPPAILEKTVEYALEDLACGETDPEILKETIRIAFARAALDNVEVEFKKK